jgi:hypothetical protein
VKEVEGRCTRRRKEGRKQGKGGKERRKERRNASEAKRAGMQGRKIAPPSPQRWRKGIHGEGRKGREGTKEGGGEGRKEQRKERRTASEAQKAGK